jgi:hypothetical protein
MSEFLADIRQWKTVGQFQQHLAKHDPAIADWVSRIVVHHTDKPNQAQWNGLATVESLKRHYQKIGWPSGPHLFICANSPNPLNDGIFQLSPLNLPGTHARTCNPYSWGIEVVGNYSNQRWDSATTTLVIGAINALCHWRNLNPLDPNVIVGHRDCNKTQCPGDAISLPDIRKAIAYTRSTAKVYYDA